MLLYTFFGIGTFLIAIYSYMFFTEQLGVNVLIGNAISWVFATTFAFLTNRTWVFVNHAKGWKAFFLQMGSFFFGRLALGRFLLVRSFFRGSFFGRFITLAIEEEMLHVLVLQQGLPNMPIKLLSQIIVIVLNYLISKLLVFRKRSVFLHHIRQKKGEI